MRAMVLTNNEVLEISEIPLGAPQEDECQIRIAAAGVCSSDIQRCFKNGAPTYPLIIGHEAAGQVVVVGSKLTKQFKLGDRVAIFPLLPCGTCASCWQHQFNLCKSYSYYGSRQHGAMAEYLNVKAWNLLKLPHDFNLEQAALLEPLSVVVHGLKSLGLSLHKKDNLPEILIIGAGFLGLIATEILLKFSHAQITLVDRHQHKLNLALQNDSSKRIHAQLLKNDGDWQKFIDSGRRYSCVLECCGNPDAYRSSLLLSAPLGRVGWMGNITHDLSLPKAEVSMILRKELKISGIWNSTYDGDQPSDWLDSVSLLQQGLDLQQFVSLRLPLEELPSLLEKLNNHKDQKEYFPLTKALVLPSGRWWAEQNA